MASKPRERLYSCGTFLPGVPLNRHQPELRGPLLREPRDRQEVRDVPLAIPPVPAVGRIPSFSPCNHIPGQIKIRLMNMNVSIGQIAPG